MTKCYCTKRSPQIDFDEKYDILYIIFGDNKMSYEEDSDVGFGLIKNIFTDDVVGITCYGYKQKHRKEQLLKLLLQYNITTDCI